ncbi:hypothetical protein GCM10009564_08700 [Streptomyces thermogriseus]|uniref:Uncharacterized protein n=1 Tax=Streptomyces thermogriseus TaxID=75292 RepID=A0ABN1SUF8_9ACTN
MVEDLSGWAFRMIAPGARARTARAPREPGVRPSPGQVPLEAEGKRTGRTRGPVTAAALVAPGAAQTPRRPGRTPAEPDRAVRCGRPDEDKGGGFLLTATSSSLENHSNALTTTRVDPRLRPAVP